MDTENRLVSGNQDKTGDDAYPLEDQESAADWIGNEGTRQQEM